MSQRMRARGSPLVAGLVLVIAALCATAVRGEDRKFCGDTHKSMVYQLSYVDVTALQTLLTTLGYQVVTKNDALDCTTEDLLVVNIPEPTNVTLVGKETFKKNTEANPRQRLLILWKKNEKAAAEKLAGLLDLLHEKADVPAKQILIEALVLELDRERFRDLGVSYRASKDGATLQFNTEGTGALFLGIARPSPKTVLDFAASLQALVDNGQAKVLSRPSVLVLDGRQAEIAIIDQLPFTQVLSSGLDVEGQIISSTKYKKVGITLSLRPRASDNDSEVSMQVVADVSAPSGPSTVNENGTVVPPEIATRKVSSHVRVANNTPFIIGGLIRSQSDVRRRGVPVLSKIPGLGALFRRDTQNRTEKEVIVVITPHVIPADDPLFSYNVAKDSELLDQEGLELFRNFYRLRSSDIYDTDFVQESDFIADLERRVIRAAYYYSEKYSPADLHPVPPGDRAGLANRIRLLLLKGSLPTPEVTFADGKGFKLPDEFLSVLDGKIPGEDILVKRMLLGIIQDRAFRNLIADEKIWFFRKPYFVAQGALCPAPSPPVPDSVITKPVITKDPDGNPLTSVGAGIVSVLALHQPLLDFQRLPDLDKLGPDCQTLVLCLEREETTFGLSLDAPLAGMSLEPVQNEDYLERLVELNNPPKPEDNRAVIMLNNCTSSGDTTSLDHLKDVLVLKRFLQLNRELPLTLDAFHVGREITFPVDANLAQRTHVVDREAAQLFYQTIDYYGAFARALLAAHSTLEPALKTAGQGRGTIGATQTSSAGLEKANRPEVRIVVWRRGQPLPRAEPRPIVASLSHPSGDLRPVQIHIERGAAGTLAPPP